MKFKTEIIRNNLKICSSLGDFVFLDVENNNVYLSSDNQAVQLGIEFENIKDDEKKVFVISKDDFLHICSFTEEITLNAKYQYVGGVAKGKFEHNETFIDVLDSIKIMFEQQDSYESMFTLDTVIMDKISRGSIFVNPDDSKAMQRNLNIKDGKIFSTSLYRMYFGDIGEVTTDAIIPSEVVKFLLQLGVGAELKNNSDSFLLTKDNISMYFSTMQNVEFLPVLEESFQSRLLPIFDTNAITFEIKDLITKLNFINFYAKNTPNNLAFLKVSDDGQALLSTNDENSVEVDTVEIKKIEDNDDEFSLPFDSLSLQNILTKLSKGGNDNVTVYASRDNGTKLFVLSFSESEKVIMSKINA